MSKTGFAKYFAICFDSSPVIALVTVHGLVQRSRLCCVMSRSSPVMLAYIVMVHGLVQRSRLCCVMSRGSSYPMTSLISVVVG
jgi:hypothetical protein